MKEIRKKKGMTQEDLAERLEVTPTYLSKIERGKQPLKMKMAARIAKELDCGIEELNLQIKWNEGKQ